VRSIALGGFSGATGTLNVLNGGVVQTTGTNFGVTVGGTNAAGTVNVTDTGSTLSSAGRIQVGAFDNSIGSMTISAGGTVQTTGTNLSFTELETGTGMNATGMVTVTGAGSTLTAGGILVGTNTIGNTASLVISNGALFLQAYRIPLSLRPLNLACLNSRPDT
jgi:T5SS/PEP-CTERM-associated repeat protein